MNENKNCISFVLRCLIAILFVVCFFFYFSTMYHFIFFFFVCKINTFLCFRLLNISYFSCLTTYTIHNYTVSLVFTLYSIVQRSLNALNSFNFIFILIFFSSLFICFHCISSQQPSLFQFLLSYYYICIVNAIHSIIMTINGRQSKYQKLKLNRYMR